MQWSGPKTTGNKEEPVLVCSRHFIFHIKNDRIIGQTAPSTQVRPEATLHIFLKNQLQDKNIKKYTTTFCHWAGNPQALH